MRRAIFECRACGQDYCTVRTQNDERPVRCIHWFDICDWVRIDKHDQKQLSEFRPSVDPAENQELAGLGRGLY